MSKASKIKSDLDDVDSILEIISILKDVATNHFYSSARKKERFGEFAVEFVDFFRMVSLSEAESPLVHSTSDKTCFLLVTSDGGFMADMNTKIIKRGVAESGQHNTNQIICLGDRSSRKLSDMVDIPLQTYPGAYEAGLFKLTMQVKQYVVEKVKKGSFGRLLVIYPKAVTANFLKPVTVTLLPSEELVTHQKEIKDTIEQVIVESDLNDIIDYLADVWITCRIYEFLEDCIIAGFAAQAQQLESAVEKLKKDKKGLMTGFRKASKADIDKSLREVFSAKMMVGGKR